MDGLRGATGPTGAVRRGRRRRRPAIDAAHGLGQRGESVHRRVSFTRLSFSQVSLWSTGFSDAGMMMMMNFADAVYGSGFTINESNH